MHNKSASIFLLLLLFFYEYKMIRIIDFCFVSECLEILCNFEFMASLLQKINDENENIVWSRKADTVIRH